jgi:hypothetical protein
MPGILTFITSVTILGIVAWTYVLWRRQRKPKAKKEDHITRQERAVWAWATVLSSTTGPVNMARQARVELELEVHMPGTPPYQAKTTWMVDEEALVYVQKGKELSLKVDPQGPEYIYPQGSWAKYLE